MRNRVTAITSKGTADKYLKTTQIKISDKIQQQNIDFKRTMKTKIEESD